MSYRLETTDVFDDWHGSLRDRRAKQLVSNNLIKLQGGNFGNVEPVGEGVSEMKIDYGPGYRLYFVSRGKVIIVLLLGGDKSSQQRDIRRAKKMAQQL